MPITIMLVDDQAFLREQVKYALERRFPDFKIIATAANGAEAVELAGRLQPDVILMDVQMPVMDGIEATRRITEQFPAIRVLGFSSVPELYADSMMEAGAKGTLEKAVTPEELERGIRLVQEGKCDASAQKTGNENNSVPGSYNDPPAQPG